MVTQSRSRCRRTNGRRTRHPSGSRRSGEVGAAAGGRTDYVICRGCSIATVTVALPERSGTRQVMVDTRPVFPFRPRACRAGNRFCRIAGRFHFRRDAASGRSAATRNAVGRCQLGLEVARADSELLQPRRERGRVDAEEIRSPAGAPEPEVRAAEGAQDVGSLQLPPAPVRDDRGLLLDLIGP